MLNQDILTQFLAVGQSMFDYYSLSSFKNLFNPTQFLTVGQSMFDRGYNPVRVQYRFNIKLQDNYNILKILCNMASSSFSKKKNKKIKIVFTLLKWVEKV